MKTLAVVPVVALLLVGLTGCGPSSADNAAAVELAFLKALADGDGAAAVALTDLDTDALACEDMISEYRDLTVGIVVPEVGKTTVSGDHATVEYTYTMVTGGEPLVVTGEHTLVREGNTWLVGFPDDYRITAELPADVVAEYSIDASPGDAGTCATTTADTDTFDVIALPGFYRLQIRDPSGVFSQSYDVMGRLVADGESDTDIPEYIDADDREGISILVTNELIDPVTDCANSNFTVSVCPAGLPAAEGAVTVSPYPGKRYSDLPTPTSIYSDDGATWRFIADDQEFLFQRNGIDQSYPMDYRGAIVLDASGDIAVVLD